MTDIVERLRTPSDNESVMESWDTLRAYLLDNKRGSYARDIFEAILSNIDEEREEAADEIERLRKALEAIRDGYGPNHLSVYALSVARAALDAIKEG